MDTLELTHSRCHETHDAHDDPSTVTPEPVPVWLITGFLGSGKTTLVNRLLRDPELSRAAVVVGEYGEVGLDHLLIHAPAQRVRVVDSGCICGHVEYELGARLSDVCEIGTRLLDLYEQRRRSAHSRNPEDGFDRVLIETSGLADPVPLIQLLLTDPVIAPLYALQSVITVVDGMQGVDTLELYPVSMKQLAVADTVLISKTDLAEEESLVVLRARIATINTSALRFEAAHGAVDRGSLFARASYADRGRDPSTWLGEIAACPATPMVPDRSIRTFTLEYDGEVTRPGLVLWLNLLAGFRGAGLLRVKGIINVEGEPVAVHAVQRVISEPQPLSAWPDGDRRTRLVFIVCGMSPQDLRATFVAFRTEAGRDTRNMTLRPEYYREFRRAIEAFR